MRKSVTIDVDILDILKRYASNEKRLTYKEIQQHLSNEYETDVSIDTVGDYCRALKDRKLIRGDKGCYMVPKFTDAEIRILLDGIFYSKQIPDNLAKNLIKKLQDETPSTQSKKYKNVVYVEAINRTDNEHVPEIIDALEEGIQKRVKVVITTCGYTEQKILVDRETYVVNPYDIVSDKQRYYLICYSGRHMPNVLETRRIDRISNVTLLTEPVLPVTKFEGCENGLNIKNFMRQHMYMMSGKSENITMWILKRSIGEFIDWYCKDFTILQERNECIRISFMANLNAFYYWALQYGDLVLVTTPAKLVDRLKNTYRTMLERYLEGLTPRLGEML